MKLFKRLFSYLIAFTMVLSLATLFGSNVHAADSAEHVITINNAPTGRKYVAYQILKGDYSNGTLSNVEWGNGVTSSKLLKKLAEDTTNFSGITTDSSARNVAEKLNPGKDTDQAKAFAKYAEASKAGNGTTSSQTTTTSGETTTINTTITVTGSGYYLVLDTTPKDSQSSKNESYTRYIVKVVGGTAATEINLKGTVPTVEKKVDDINESTETKEKLRDSADYNIGESVPYTITGTLPSNYNDYTSYKYEFTDTMCKGLSYAEKTAKVWMYTSDNDTNPDDVTDAFTETITDAPTAADNSKDKVYNGGKVIKWSCDDLYKHDKTKNAVYGYKFVVKYNATLTTDAIVGSAGNPNKVDLTYSNNPNNSGNGETGKTPEDKNIVFTYAAKFNKVNGSNKPLADAKFTLYKFTTNKIAESDIADKHNNVSGYWHSLGEKEATKQDDNYTAYYKGLDDGVYKLVETHTPDGYNTMADKIFTVTATHNDGDEPSFDTLTVNDLKTTIDDGTFTSDIVNNSGSILPSTGGMGTTLLYVAGGILVACAAAYVVLNKKRA